jgi:hypothetical protein
MTKKDFNLTDALKMILNSYSIPFIVVEKAVAVSELITGSISGLGVVAGAAVENC